MRYLTTLFVTALFLLVTLNCSHALTDQPQPRQPEVETQKTETHSKEIESYWTEEKMIKAKPMQAEKVIPQSENSKRPPQPDQKK
jgi:hypothetical protein